MQQRPSNRPSSLQLVSLYLCTCASMYLCIFACLFACLFVRLLIHIQLCMSLYDHIPLLHSTFACQGICSSHFFEAQGPNAPSTGTWQRPEESSDPTRPIDPLPIRSSKTCLVSFGRLPAEALFLHSHSPQGRWEPHIPTSQGEPPDPQSFIYVRTTW